ncbi:MAG: tyrosine-protein phosphatase [Bacteroidota bacterium]
MIQYKIINQFTETAKTIKGIDIVILYGSFAGKQASQNSDIDIAIVTNTTFDALKLSSALKESFCNFGVLDILHIELRNKVVIYFRESPKLEIAVHNSLIELQRNYLGSEIRTEDIDDTILYDNTGLAFEVLTDFTKKKKNGKRPIAVGHLVQKFIYEFESCSKMHSRGDGYQFHFFYNIALHIATQLRYLAEGNSKYYFLPKNLTANIIVDKKEQEEFYNLAGSCYLPQANAKKRQLLNFFYRSVEKLGYAKIPEIRNLLEFIYERDFMWNFRDIAQFNKCAPEGLVFRTSSLTRYQNEGFLIPFLKEKNIETIIDLRAEREIEESPYEDGFISNFKYIKAQFDPWNQPEWFKKTEHYGTDTEIAYRFFVKACKNQIKLIFDILCQTKGAMAIHCFAGKDRTGFIVFLINSLFNTPYSVMLSDYLASEMDTTKEKFDIYWNLIEKEGGITNYLLSCGVSTDNIHLLMAKYLKYEKTI